MTPVARSPTRTVRVFSGRVTDSHAVWDTALGGVRLGPPVIRRAHPRDR